MVIQKNEKNYSVTELKRFWKLSRVEGILTVDFNVPKTTCPTFADLEKYVAGDKTF